MSEQTPACRGSARRRILLVDDDRKLVGVTKRMLEHIGYEVRSAVDVPLAKRAFEETTPDVVLIDVNLPGGDGVELCREIRAVSDVPIIFVTGMEKTDELLESGFDAGGDDYLTKPVNFNELKLRIEAILRRAGKKAAEKELGREVAGFDEEKFERLMANLGGREKEVARLIALGKNNKEIAGLMDYTDGHIRNMTTLIYAQVGVSNRQELKKAILYL
jgi:DNA-binding response OmpR family regulator